MGKTDRSKKLAYILRHNPSEVEGTLDSSGWLETKKLLDHGWTLEELKEIVSNDNKKRYEFSGDYRKIRAFQGHSIKGINADLKKYTGCRFVYHGTQRKFLESIFKDGLVPGSREYVHLSPDPMTARNVALRRGPEIAILRIDLEGLEDEVYVSGNGVILVKRVSPEHIVKVSYDFGDE